MGWRERSILQNWFLSFNFLLNHWERQAGKLKWKTREEEGTCGSATAVTHAPTELAQKTGLAAASNKHLELLPPGDIGAWESGCC